MPGSNERATPCPLPLAQQRRHSHEDRGGAHGREGLVPAEVVDRTAEELLVDLDLTAAVTEAGQVLPASGDRHVVEAEEPTEVELGGAYGGKLEVEHGQGGPVVAEHGVRELRVAPHEGVLRLVRRTVRPAPGERIVQLVGCGGRIVCPFEVPRPAFQRSGDSIRSAIAELGGDSGAQVAAVDRRHDAEKASDQAALERLGLVVKPSPAQIRGGRVDQPSFDPPRHQEGSAEHGRVLLEPDHRSQRNAGSLEKQHEPVLAAEVARREETFALRRRHPDDEPV